MSKFTFDVFISYSHADADWVKTWLLPRLEAARLRVCVDYRDFKLGVPSLDNMADAAVRSRKTLFVMTPNWTVSEFGQFESLVTQTIDPIGRSGRLLPLMLKDCDLPARLQILTYADFKEPGNWENELARVVKDISESSDDRQPASPPPGLAPNLVHPYPMQANFTGRADERRDLTAWLADDGRPICALVAMGGMGKSALAWHWVTNDVLPAATSSTDGVMWWSFYEGESSFARFIDEALRYVGDRPIDPQLFPTTYDRAQELRRLLQTRRVLFVLDGFERQLRAYASLDAAYRPDDATDPTRDARSCVDPTAIRLLRDIAAGATRAKLLLTTRLPVSDLEDRAGDPLAGVFKRELKELPQDDAITFMHAQGVTKGTPAEIVAACEAYGYHPLSLRLLSGLIARDARNPGDIATAPRHDVHHNLIQRQHHVLEQSYNALPKRERALLSRVAAFRNPTTYDALLIFNTLGSETRFDAALEDLQERGLMQRDIGHRRYDLHPIVRHYAYERLPDKKRVHTRLRDYFVYITADSTNEVQSIEDLAPFIELYHHTAHAGNYDEAFKLFSQFGDMLYHRFGAYQLIIELGQALAPVGEGQLPLLKEELDHGLMLNALAISYAKTGQSRRAAPLLEMVNHIYQNQAPNVEFLATSLGNLAYRHIELGELATAEQTLRRAVALYQTLNDKANEAILRQELAGLLSYKAEFIESEKELSVAMKSHKAMERAYPGISKEWQGKVWADSALRSLLMGDSHASLEAAQQARKLVDEAAKMQNPIEHDVIRVEWLLGVSQVREGAHLDAAYAHLTDALKRCRRINLVELEPNVLLAWAHWHHTRGNKQEALAYAGEALGIADRCEYRLKQAEIHNFLARLSLDEGAREAAREHAEVARERAWCDGPPYCYRVALDEAEGMLRELGVGEEK